MPYHQSVQDTIHCQQLLTLALHNHKYLLVLVPLVQNIMMGEYEKWRSKVPFGYGYYAPYITSYVLQQRSILIRQSNREGTNSIGHPQL